jgi:hypothetical protein
MQPIDSTIYAVCVKDQPVRYSSRSRIIPLLAHACALSSEERAAYKAMGYEMDDENAHLSEVNPYFAELSCIEWILNNSSEDNIGNAQYRRNWEEDENLMYDPEVLYVPQAARFGFSLAQQFVGGHQFPGVGMTMAMSMKGGWPFTKEEMEKVWEQNEFHGCLMARGSQENYKRFMRLLMECMVPLWETFKNQLVDIEGYDRRSIAFMAERVMTGLILYRGKFFPDMTIHTAPIGFVGP